MRQASIPLKVEMKVHLRRGGHGRKRLANGKAPSDQRTQEGELPHLTRLMALAIRFDGLIRDGEIADYAEIARVGRITRARASQIMNLMNLAPDIQEALLDLPRVLRNRDAISERLLRPIAAEPDWRVQRRMWAHLTVT